MIDRVQGYFGFTRVPFGRNLAPSMLHQHHSHREAAARIAGCINNRAIGVVTGEVGSGKTVVLKGAVASLDPARFTVIYHPTPEVGLRGLYNRIVTSLGDTPKIHLAALAAQAPQRWPPRSTNAATPPRPSSSTSRTCSTTANWTRSGCSPTTTWTPPCRSRWC